jgi:hypothetical protein
VSRFDPASVTGPSRLPPSHGGIGRTSRGRNRHESATKRFVVTLSGKFWYSSDLEERWPNAPTGRRSSIYG